MYGEQKFLNDVQTLLTAYHKGTLLHNICAACAIGTLLGEDNKSWTRLLNSGYEWESLEIIKLQNHRDCKIRYTEEYFNKEEKMVGRIVQITNPIENYPEAAIKLLELGYTYEEIQDIEFAFECGDLDRLENEIVIEGLTNVIKELGKINWIDEELIQDQINKL